MDAAIKWRAVKLDSTSNGEPRISRAELLDHAIEQWSLADIRSALTPDEWRAFVKRCGIDYDRLTARDRDALRSGARADATAAAASAALLLPAKKAAARRRAARGVHFGTLVTPPQFKRRRRMDDVREFTLTGLGAACRDVVPMLRVRGRWLARLGFKPGMRIYITAKPGELVISTTDPAVSDEQSTATPAQLMALPPLALAAQTA